jgi:hypothetical protein
MSARMLLLLGALGCAGCSVLSSPDREYSSNARVLAAIEDRLDYRVDRSEFLLTRAEITDDAITLHYLGVAHPGDQAWVVRFSEKSTELSPERLATVAPALAVIEGERLQPDFAARPPAETEVAGVRIEAATYTFRSTLAPAGRSGRGVLAALRRTERGDEVVYQIKLDNHGDRANLTAEDLAPLLAPLALR